MEKSNIKRKKRKNFALRFFVLEKSFSRLFKGSNEKKEAAVAKINGRKNTATKKVEN